jgi:iron complex outermembrane receptor protein
MHPLIRLTCWLSLAGIAPGSVFAQATPSPAERLDRPIIEEGVTSEGVTVMPEVVVTAEGGRSYTAREATTATRFEAPLRDIPQSIQVVPRKVFEDQAVTRPADAVRNVSGVVRTQAYLGFTDSFTIRGFDAPTGLWNGTRRDMYYTFTDVSQLERIEVLKGPASINYGYLEPGGVVNYVTKKPLATSRYQLELSTATFDFYRAAADFSGPLNAAGTVRYRLTGAHEQAGSFRDFVESELTAVSPRIDWDISESTRLSLEFSYVHANLVPDRGFSNSLGPVIFKAPIERFLGEPADSYEVDQFDFAITLEHDFTEELKLRVGFHGDTYEDYRDIFQQGSLQADGRTISRSYSKVDGLTENYTAFANLTAKFSTWQLQHTLLVGIDLNRRKFPYTFRSGPGREIDLFDPHYGAPRIAPPALFDFDNQQDSAGLYAQDLIEITDKVKLLAGVRYDYVDYRESDVVAKTAADFDKTGVSPRVGLVYQPVPEVSLFTSYSRSFLPNNFARTRSGDVVDPEIGTQWEAGVKGEFFGGRLNPSLAVYEITKENVAVPDPNDPTELFSVISGEQRSRGIEFDVTATPVDGWDFIGSWAYTDARVTEDTTIPVGNQLLNVPHHQASFWMNYRFQNGWLKGLGLGAGVFYVGEREAQLPNTFNVPAYTRLDAAISYERDFWKAALNFKNIGNERYYDSQRNLLYPGAPFTVQATLTLTF